MLERDLLYSIKELQDKSDENIALVVVYSTSNDNPLDHLNWVEDSLRCDGEVQVDDKHRSVLFDLSTVEGNNKGRFVMAEFTSGFSYWDGRYISGINKDSIKVVESINITYKNYKGEVGSREIIPIGDITFDSNEFHKTPQWLMPAYDVNKQDIRMFAFKDIISIDSED
jgi:hypothetical protein